MSRYVLVHGAWHTGAAWDGVARALARAGHDVVAPTLPERGRAGPARFADYVDAVVAALAPPATPAVLVGHSLGAAVALEAAARRPSAVARLVLLAGLVPVPGRALLDDYPAEYRANLARLAARRDDGRVALPYALWRRQFLPEVAEADARCAFRSLRPEPLAPVSEPLDVAHPARLPVPVMVLHCTRDQVMPAGPWSLHPRMTDRLAQPEVIPVEAGHEWLYADAEACAAMLGRAATDEVGATPAGLPRGRAPPI